MQMLNISISHEAVRDIGIKSGIKIIEKENEEIKQSLKASRKALIRLNNCESNEYYRNAHIDSQSPIYQAIRQMPISELEYII